MSHSQFHSIKLFILRHAWLNLWDKHMTTGRINQVTTVKKRKRKSKKKRDGDWIKETEEFLITIPCPSFCLFFYFSLFFKHARCPKASNESGSYPRRLFFTLITLVKKHEQPHSLFWAHSQDLFEGPVEPRLKKTAQSILLPVFGFS
jgi:hypothetical protein